MRIGWPHVALGLAGLAVVAAGFWWFAPYNVAASQRHLPPVRAFLHSYMDNAVGRRAAALDPPDWFRADDPALIRLGAAHFATGCATCHGAPGLPRNAIVTAMLPEPTLIEETEHTTREFYWLARHGLKYTGMPAWAGQGRDDEPWAVAAFLSRYSALDPDSYRELAHEGGSAAPVGAAVAFGGMRESSRSTIDNCARCHGADGMGRDGTAPKLAGQSEGYLLAALDAYAADRRQSGFMEPVAIALTPQERADLARRYSAMAADLGTGQPGRIAGDVLRGRLLATHGDEHDELPSCMSCHGAGKEPPGLASVPRIAGQDARWLVTWLRLWRDGPIPDGPAARRMAAAARNLSDRDIADLAAFYSAGAKTEQAGEQTAP
ncbi:c-type cytochrome [Frigidibacter sp. SD6-1]|uniref:c-type cytochrome n=1 Tax=Frigidibacter sp. SD6-1 TaxID=3032581 RepID=UPI0024DF60E3|nr:c-type cytochrome [Frigidibacter sp. SD6-1]